jgi:UPF0755 protein
VKRVLLLAIVLLLAGVAGAFFWFRGQLTRPYKGYEPSEVFVEIPPGSTESAIGRRLVDAGVVRDRMVFRMAVRATGAGRRLQAGEYRFDQPMTPLEVIGKLARGDVFLLQVTFPEGLNARDMAAIYERRGFGSASEFLAAAGNPAPIAALDPAAADLEGYLFPDTYALPRSAGAAGLVAQMVGRFEQAFGPALRAQAAARGLTVRQTVTLASLVEKETGRPEERTLVAAVYANRLRIGMGLQCDPTVIYALQKAGRYNGNLTRADLQFDSPYNTYRYPGLPPGPIASPGVASLEAALNPADVRYIYFVSRNDGSHAFASTLAEHNRNVQRYQVEYFREKRQPAAARQGTLGQR